MSKYAYLYISSMFEYANGHFGIQTVCARYTKQRGYRHIYMIY